MFILYLWNWNEGQFTFYIWLSRLSGQPTETENEMATKYLRQIEKSVAR